ncbi:MAG: hypothetical protein MI757_16015 [Pirellulales bacterium]|nr:hypothetical protein [Pirellulales bacterium]
MKVRGASSNHVVSKAKRAQHGTPLSKRARGGRPDPCVPFAPPEDWHEPSEESSGEFRFVVQPAGKGFRHILTPAMIRQRLARLPAWMLEPLEVIQLSRMTRKKRSFPCYGMQWGPSLYIYPMEESLTEYYGQPPKPSQVNEARAYGGRWIHESRGVWKLVWTPEAIEDFYLNNILIHELGHLLDNRNRSYRDRERYAEWFADHHGRRQKPKAKQSRKVRKRHHSA